MIHLSRITNARKQGAGNVSKNTLNDIVACKTRIIIFLLSCGGEGGWAISNALTAGKSRARVAMRKKSSRCLLTNNTQTAVKNKTIKRMLEIKIH